MDFYIGDRLIKMTNKPYYTFICILFVPKKINLVTHTPN